MIAMPDWYTSLQPSDVDQQLCDRARRVIPGGMYGHKNVALLPKGYPQFFERGSGALLWDVSGREYVDLMCSWGPVVLGHHNRAVDSAVAEQAARGDCLDGPSPVMVELAELMTDTVSHADWAIFCKNGTDATSLAVSIARAETNRGRVLMAEGAYHGIAPWSATEHARGVRAQERAGTERYTYNDISSLERAVQACGGDLAAIAVTPIRHEVRRDLEDVHPDFARRVRELCDKLGAVLILDEIRCGLRADPRGSWEHLGIRPDLSAWSKAIGNGYPIACLLGVRALEEAATSVSATGSFWLGAVPMAAALATIGEVRRPDVLAGMVLAGSALQTGLRERAAAHGISVSVSGPPTMPFMTFEGDTDFDIARLWASACIQHGLYVHPTHNWFIGAAHTSVLIERSLEASDQAFRLVRLTLS